MKQIIIIIRPEKYFELKKTLIQNNFHQMTSIDVFGRGKEAVGFTYFDEVQASEDFAINYLILKKRIDIYIRDEDEQHLVEIVLRVCQTGQKGDGKIFAIPLEGVQRIHTGEYDENALV